MAQMSPQPVGAATVSLSPGDDCETAFIDDESQRNISRKFTPFSLIGARVAIWPKMPQSDPSTPTEKNARHWAASPCLTGAAGDCHSAVGPPSVMRSSHGG